MLTSKPPIEPAQISLALGTIYSEIMHGTKESAAALVLSLHRRVAELAEWMENESAK
jgi:hypothetical protein